MKNRYHDFLELNKKILPISAVLFLIANIILQYEFFFYFFLNPYRNADESGYIWLLSTIHNFDISFFSNSNSQPFALVCYLFKQFFDDPKFILRFISLLSSITTVVFLYYYYKKYKFVSIVTDNKWINNLIIFNVLFAVFSILSQHFIGTSDTFSVAFGLPGFILLTEVLLNQRKHNVVFIGFLLAVSFTTRPTFLVILLAFLLALFICFPKKIVSKKLIFVGGFFILFTALINFSPLLKSGTIVLDVKEIPKETGTSWFEMNYLMAKKWDAGEIPNTQWLSQDDVIKYKKENPDFVFPKNNFEIIINDSGLFFRQMLRMTAVSMYSSFRYLLFLFPFLIFYYFIKSKNEEKTEVKKVYFTVIFYFVSLILLMAIAIKLMEFRWMYIPVVFYAFYALHYSKGISSEKRIVLFNLVFLAGIGFLILKMLK